MTEPQLSAEMEKRFDEQKFELGEDAGGNPVYLSSDEFVSKQVKQFLATALEEQRQEILGEVEKMITEVESVNESNGRYNACQELRARLNQLKGITI